MFYHTTRLALNRPFLDLGLDPTQFSDCLNICDTSIDIVISIIHRFKTQHTLRNAPLVFVYGCIRAADAIFAILHHQARDPRDLQETVLPSFHTALAEMSHTWKLADRACQGLQLQVQNMSSKHHETPSVQLSLPDTEVGISETISTLHNDGFGYSTFGTEFTDDLGFGVCGGFDEFCNGVQMVQEVHEAPLWESMPDYNISTTELDWV